MKGPPGVRVAGHFGELLQGRLGPDGPVALLTLPCPALGVTAWAAGGRGLALHGGLVAPARARRFLTALGLPLPGRVVLRAEAPPGGGAGMSTAALVALARAAGWRGDPLRLARACVAAEGASDPLMLDDAATVLWASRQGRVLGRMAPLARCEIVGGFVGPPRRTDPADDDFPHIADLVARWRPDLATQAALASESAARRLGTRGVAAGLVRATGALGWVAAHTGSAQGLVFAPGTVPARLAAALRDMEFSGVLRFRAGLP
ncbi:propanediol utilization protein [Paracoccus luteus]|uniref:propanediol utilization protein n=1 Tax=Paracoccus luteus TaxID=2508543 RepID=UPI0014315063|nr:propanediol utilization protein [Paracoccus luteus]